MDRPEIESALKAAFSQCEKAFCSLTERQKQIVLETTLQLLTQEHESEENPLDELTSEQRQSLLEFIQVQQAQDVSWKISLLNDWLDNRDSGAVQFIRNEYGFSWLNRVQPVHIQQYLEESQAIASKLKVGDRIEVSNGLWEWVQEEGPCAPEWFPCEVIGISEMSDKDLNYINCTVRFETGSEFEIQGIYEWNRCNWRFPSV